jgi:hypothetical protein
VDTACASHLCIVSTRSPSCISSMSDSLHSSVNKSLKGKWASLACHETGSLVVQVRLFRLHIHASLIHFQHAFENLEADAKDGIVDELLNHGPAVFADVAKNQWGAYCIQHSAYCKVFLRLPYS